jgi:hypothetical protein
VAAGGAENVAVRDIAEVLLETVTPPMTGS